MILSLFLALATADTYTDNVKNTLLNLRTYPENVSRSDIDASLSKFMKDSLVDYYNKRNLPASLNPKDPDFAKVVERAVRLEVSNILAGNVSYRTDFFIEIITGQWAEGFYAKLLKLKLQRDNPKASRTGLDYFSIQDSTYFSGRVKDVVITDRGLEGNENKVVDAGEFITLSLPIINKSDTYLYSTSAFVYSMSSYVSTFNIEEIELDELDPGDETVVKVKFYLSKNVPNDTVIPINIKMYDSRHFPSTPDVLTYNIKVKNLKGTRLRNVVVDTDMPGSSEDETGKRLQQGQHFEVRNDLYVQDALAHKAYVEYTTNPLLPFDYRAGILESNSSKSGRLFMARDDLDFVLPKGTLYSELISSTARYVWLSKNEPVTFIAVDSTVHLKSTSKSQTSKKEPVAPKKAEILSASTVLSLLEENIKLEPLRVAPPSGALDAAHGFQISLDEDAFTKSYNQKLYGEQEANSDVPQNVSSLSKVSTALFNEDNGTYYTYRHYIELPLEPVKISRRTRDPEPQTFSDSGIRLQGGFKTQPGYFLGTVYKDAVVGWAGQVSVFDVPSVAAGLNVQVPLADDEDLKFSFNVRPMVGHNLATQSSYLKLDLGPDILVNSKWGGWMHLELNPEYTVALGVGIQYRFGLSE